MKTEIILKEGYPYIAVTGGLFLISLLFRFPLLVQIITFALFAFMVFFFRNPERIPEDDSKGAVISPSDGVVTEITNAISPLTNKESIKISIRLSLTVHTVVWHEIEPPFLPMIFFFFVFFLLNF